MRAVLRQSPLATGDGTARWYAFEHLISKSSDSASWSPLHARPAAWHACTAMRHVPMIWTREGGTEISEISRGPTRLKGADVAGTSLRIFEWWMNRRQVLTYPQNTLKIGKGTELGPFHSLIWRRRPLLNLSLGDASPRFRRPYFESLRGGISICQPR